MCSQLEAGEKVLDSRGPAGAQGLRSRQHAWGQCSVSGGQGVSEEIMSDEARKEAGARSPGASVSCQRGATILTRGRGRGHGGREGGKQTTRVLLAVTVLGLSSPPHFQCLRENTGAQEHWVTP